MNRSPQRSISAGRRNLSRENSRSRDDDVKALVKYSKPKNRKQAQKQLNDEYYDQLRAERMKKNVPATRNDVVGMSNRIKKIQKAIIASSNRFPQHTDWYMGQASNHNNNQIDQYQRTPQRKRSIRNYKRLDLQRIKQTPIYKDTEKRILFEAASRVKVPSNLVLDRIQQLKTQEF